VQLAAVAELFLGDPGFGPGLTKICGKALLRGHGSRFFGAEDRNSTDKKIRPIGAAACFATLQARVARVIIRFFTQKALSVE
jgi:hypothetical protein